MKWKGVVGVGGLGVVMSELSMRVGGMDVLEGMGWIVVVSVW